jgi:Glycosyl transferase family 2
MTCLPFVPPISDTDLPNGNAVPSETLDSDPKGRRRLISLVMPVYNEEANLDRAYAALTAVLAGLPEYDLEFVFTDNHSEDRTSGSASLSRRHSTLPPRNLKHEIIGSD